MRPCSPSLPAQGGCLRGLLLGSSRESRPSLQMRRCAPFNSGPEDSKYTISMRTSFIDFHCTLKIKHRPLPSRLNVLLSSSPAPRLATRIQNHSWRDKLFQNLYVTGGGTDGPGNNVPGDFERRGMHMKVRPVTLHEITLPRFVGFQ